MTVWIGVMLLVIATLAFVAAELAVAFFGDTAAAETGLALDAALRELHDERRRSAALGTIVLDVEDLLEETLNAGTLDVPRARRVLASIAAARVPVPERSSAP